MLSSLSALAAALGVALAAGCFGGPAAPPDDAPPRPTSTAPTSPAPDAPATARPDSAAASLPPGAADAPRPPLPEGFVYLRDVAPEIAQEMRYTTAFNFVGARIDGYGAPECILTREAAEALARVDVDLARRGLGLKVYDCYRPQMAVDHFVRWARSGDETMKAAFFPDEPTTTLFQRGYIARRSGHTRGSTLDLTLVRWPAVASVVPASRYPNPETDPLPRCDGGVGVRFAEGDLDMGTAYDCLSTHSATAFAGIPAEARRNRQTLRAAMARASFDNYSKEWWHFTLRDEPFPRTYHTFPVE